MNVINTKFAKQFKKQATKFKTVIGTRGRSCLFFHRWNLKYTLAGITYTECKHCTTRMLQGDGFISNQAIKWVTHANQEK